MIGLGAAGSLIGGVTTQILSAASAGLVGTKKALENDVFYNNTVPIIILQMEKDRTCWGSVIEARLDNDNYQTLKQGFNDLIAYSRAGSFHHALIAMQASTGAQASANLTALQATKAGSSKKNAAASKPAAASDTKAPPATTTPVEPDSNVVSTCGAPATQQPSAPKNVAVATINAGTVTMPYNSSADPFDAAISATNHVATSAKKLSESLKTLATQLGKLPSSADVTAYTADISKAADKVTAAQKTFNGAIADIRKRSPSPEALSSAYFTAQRNLENASADAQVSDLKLTLALAQVRNSQMSDEIAKAQTKFDADVKSAGDTVTTITQYVAKSTPTLTEAEKQTQQTEAQGL